jgi:predicted enzyme related to lactoylglutathione lyase
MFADRTVTTMVPAKDLERAKTFYADKLGLTPADSSGEGGVVYELGDGTGFFLYASEFAGTAKHTLISLDTPDLAADIAALRGKGVTFEEYDLPDLKTVNGVAEWGPVKNAWFKDSEGNIIGLVQGM